MKWGARTLLLGLVAAQQVTCWSTLGPVLGGVAWWPSFAAVLAAQLVVLGVSARWEDDEAEVMRRRVGWALSGLALLIPGLGMPLELAAVVLAVVVFRLSRAAVWRFAIPSLLAVLAFATFMWTRPWTLDLRRDLSALYWGFAPVGIVLLGYLVKLAAIVRNASRIPSAGAGTSRSG